jgi:hypothetical protein
LSARCFESAQGVFDELFFQLLERCKFGSEFVQEARVELFKQLSNLRFDFLKRLYDRHFIWERYLLFGHSIHLHARLAVGGLCLSTFSPDDKPEIQSDKPVVLVRVGKFSEKPCPVASVTRLIPLEQCAMFLPHAFEMAQPLSRKLAFAAFNRKLESVGDFFLRTIIVPHSNCHIVQGRPQVVNEISDDNVNGVTFKLPNFEAINEPIIMDLLINRIRVHIPVGFKECFQLRQVFMCPFYPQLGLEKFPASPVTSDER